MQNLDLDAYFARINYTGSREPTADTLRNLHRSHMYAVPFENLDIHIKRPIVLETERIFDKIVNQGRGGFCYEQNGVFSAVLRQLGYDVTLMEARVSDENGNFKMPFDHLTLLVNLDERWLADVGFGDSFTEPLLFDEANAQIQGNNVFYVAHDAAQQGIFSHRDINGDWQGGYQFFLKPRQLDDFSGTCHFHQTSPDSHFTKGRVCSLATPTGRVTLRDNRLIFTENGEKSEQPIESETAFQAALQKYFGIKIPE
jgi:N-hydroxyarylamine O-acetyltransferase